MPDIITQWGLRCPDCGEEIYSNNRHDWESCWCGELFIDGGWDYMRAGGAKCQFAERVSRQIDKRDLPKWYSEEPAVKRSRSARRGWSTRRGREVPSDTGNASGGILGAIQEIVE